MRLYRFEIDQALCRQCGTCLKICPRNAVFERDDACFVIDTIRCDACGLCRDACKLRAIAKKHGIFKS